MKTFWLILFLSLCIILQISLVHMFDVHGVSIDLILIIVVYLALKKNTQAAFALIGASLIIDLFSGIPFGLESGILLLIAFATPLLVHLFVNEVGNPGIILMVILMTVLAHTLMYLGILGLRAVGLIDMMYLARDAFGVQLLWSLLIQFLAAVVLMPLLNRFFSFLSLYERHQFGKVARF